MASRITLAVLLSIVAAGRTAVAQETSIVFLGNRDYAPLSYLERGEPTGLDVDIIRAVAAEMGRAVRIELIDWRDAQTRVLRGEADALTDLAVTEERRLLYDFTDPIATHEFGLFVRSGNATIHGVGDLAGKTVGVTSGGLPRLLLENRGDVHVVLVDTYADGLAQLSAGTIQALAGDMWVASYAIQTRGFQNIAVAAEPFATSLANIAIPKGHDALLVELNRAIRAIRADGRLQQIQERWRPQQMLFLSRQRVRRYVIGAVAVSVAVVLATLTLWIVTLKKQVNQRREVAADLTEREQRLEMALSAADMGAWRWDYDTNMTTRDASLNRMFGLEAVETTQGLDDTFERIVPADRDAVHAELIRAVRERDTYATEYRIVRPDGSIRWLRGRGRAFYNDIGEPRYVTGTTIDVTDRREAEAALRMSEEKFARAFQTSPDCITISDIVNGRIIDVNDRFEQMTGYTRAEALGHTIVDLGLVNRGLRDQWLTLFQQTGSVGDFEYEIVRKDGRRATMLMSAEKMEFGGERRFLTVHRDITDRKRSQEALSRSESKYRDLVENANDIVFTVDTAGYCLSMNRIGQEITGIAPANPRGTHFAQLVVPEQAAFAASQLQRVLAGEEVPVFELDIAGKRGARVTLEVNVRPIDEDGAVVAAQGIARDVTTRRELELQLRQAQKMDAIGRLAAGVAHDFNNLLTVILGNCEVATPLLSSDHPVRNTLRDIRASAERAAELTRQLLAFSRRQIIQPRVLDVNDTIAEIRGMMTRLIGEHIDVRFNPDAKLWHVSADPGQLQQVIVNLSVNARDAMPEGGRVTIATRNVQFPLGRVERGVPVPAGDYVEISVSDTGTGMDVSTLERLFEPFFTTKDAGKGTGLGLATVYGIAKQNGGFVFVDSALSHGSTFWMLLPRADAPLTPASADPSGQKASGGTETVVLVEDEDDVRELIGEYLQSQGYTVVSARSGEEGVGLVRQLHAAPSLLISDIVMPGMNGRVLSEQLRASYPELKVLYVSGYTDDALITHAALPQGTHFLQKPFALSTLATTIRTIVDAPRV